MHTASVASGVMSRSAGPVPPVVTMRQQFSVSASSMGEKGRLKMEQEFDEKIVIQKYVQAIDLVLKDQRVP